MAAYNKFNLTVDDMLKAINNYGTDGLKVMLTNTLPVATNHVYGDISANELASGNGYATGGATVPGTGLSNASGVESLAGTAVTWTSSTGSMGPFRYVVLYDNSSASKTLIAWWDIGASTTLNGANGDQFVWTPAGSVIFTLQ